MAFGRLARRTLATIASITGRRMVRVVKALGPVVVTPVAIGAAVSAGAMALFFRIADDVRESDGVWRFDHDGLRLALMLRNPRRTALAHIMSAIFRPDVMTGIGFLTILLTWKHPKFRPQGVLVAVALAGGGGIIGGIKHNFNRARPTLIEALAKEGTFSFPSGHSFISLICCGILAYWRFRARKEPLQRVAVVGTAVTTVLLTGGSRVYLGVHYPSDVIAGWATAVPWLTACLTAYYQYEKRAVQLSLPVPEGLDNDA